MPDALPPDGLDHLEHVVGVDAVAGDGLAVDADPQQRQARGLLGLDVGGAGTLGSTADDLVGLRAAARRGRRRRSWTATSERTPAISSETRSSIGCE